jgi:ABC-2 type transport system permease protein
VSVRLTLAVAARVLRQLRRDPRTIVLLIVVPCALLALLRWMFDSNRATFNGVGGPMVGMFPYILMFLVTSISMLRERTDGTLERMMSMPIGRADVLFGYALAFSLVGVVQALAAAGVAFGLLGVPIAGSIGTVLVLAIANALAGMSMGLCASAFARTEFQVVQFMPALVFPQLLLCGLFLPVDSLPRALRWIADALPMTSAFDGLQRTVVVGDGLGSGRVATDLAVVAGYAVLLLAVGAATLPRRTP